MSIKTHSRSPSPQPANLSSATGCLTDLHNRIHAACLSTAIPQRRCCWLLDQNTNWGKSLAESLLYDSIKRRRPGDSCELPTRRHPSSQFDSTFAFRSGLALGTDGVSSTGEDLEKTNVTLCYHTIQQTHARQRPSQCHRHFWLALA